MIDADDTTNIEYPFGDQLFFPPYNICMPYITELVLDGNLSNSNLRADDNFYYLITPFNFGIYTFVLKITDRFQYVTTNTFKI